MSRSSIWFGMYVTGRNLRIFHCWILTLVEFIALFFFLTGVILVIKITRDGGHLRLSAIAALLAEMKHINHIVMMLHQPWVQRSLSIYQNIISNLKLKLK